MAKSDQFWKKRQASHSRVKSEIVAKYFKMWSQVLRKWHDKLGYLDLYAGKGEYKGGESSTAIRVLETAANDPFLSKNLISVLNDIRKSHCEDMLRVIKERGLDKRLSIMPNVFNNEVSALLAHHFNSIEMVPTLCFIDPYGFKGLSIGLVRSIIKDKGCDCLIFFHTSGINRNLELPNCQEDLKALFGDQAFSDVLTRVKKEKQNREEIIVESFIAEARKSGAKYVRTLQFNFPFTNRISHHLIFLSKHHRAFHLIKDVMSQYSIKEEGISKYIYTEGAEGVGEQFLIPGFGPMQLLKNQLMKEFQGRTVQVSELIDNCHKIEWPYTGKNLKAALMLLESEGKIMVDIPLSERPKHDGKPTLGDSRFITFR